MRSRAILCGVLLCTFACKGNAKVTAVPPNTEGLDLVPRQAKQIAVGDVKKLSESPLVIRAVNELLARDAKLAERVRHLVNDCGLSPQKLTSFILAMDASESLLIAHGHLEEGALVDCVSKRLPANGARLASVDIDGQPGFQVIDSENRPGLAFAFADKRTVVVASTVKWLKTSLAKGASIEHEPEFQRLFKQVKGDAALWVAGIVPDEVGRGLVEAAGGRLSKPPRTMSGHLDLKSGVEAHLSIQMSSPAEAQNLVSLAKSELQGFSLLAQKYKLGQILTELELSADGANLHVHLALSPEEVGRLTSQIDTPRAGGQDASPETEKTAEKLDRDAGEPTDAQRDAAPGSETPVRK
jgi:hypothetical protein